jgi:hypothetical protein
MKYHHDQLHSRATGHADRRETFGANPRPAEAPPLVPGFLDREGAPGDFEQARCLPPDGEHVDSVGDGVGRAG